MNPQQANPDSPRRLLGVFRRPSRRTVRTFSLWVVPIVVLAAAGYLYVIGGRYVSTENAYIKADMVSVAAQVSGPIVSVSVRENQPVAAGDLLFRIDPKPYRIALAQAQANLAQVRTEIETLKADYREKQEELALAKTDAAFAQREYQRQLKLAQRKLAAPGDLDRYRHSVDAARQKIAALQQDLASVRAKLAGNPDIPVAQHPQDRAAAAKLAEAELNLEHTEVHAPVAGVASKVPNPGDYAATGAPAMSIVANHHVWVEANYKETDLTHVRPGQSVTIEVDTYPDREWSGRVESIAQATGAEFSLLPPQNATGNWVKVVQRIPVRIAVQQHSGDPPLRAGMSVTTDIDTGYHHRGPAFLASAVTWARSFVDPAHAGTRP